MKDKILVKSWIKRKEKDDMKELILYEMLIKEILVRNMTTNVSAEDRSTLRNLESKNEESLKIFEELWRLKSEAIWVEVGDRNANCFHK